MEKRVPRRATPQPTSQASQGHDTDRFLWTGDAKEVAYIAAQTGRRPIEVRRAFMEVGPDRARVIAMLREGAPAAP